MQGRAVRFEQGLQPGNGLKVVRKDEDARKQRGLRVFATFHYRFGQLFLQFREECSFHFLELTSHVEQNICRIGEVACFCLFFEICQQGS